MVLKFKQMKTLNIKVSIMCYLEESPGVFYSRVTSRGRCLKQVVSSWKWEEAMAQGVISEDQETWDAEDHVKIRPLIQVGYMPLKGFIEELHDPMYLKRVILDTWLNSHHSSVYHI